MTILTLLLLLITLPTLQANAEKTDDGTFTYEITEEGTATLTGVVNSYPVGELVIPESVNGYPVTVIDRSAFEGYSDITAVSLPDTLVCIKENAFYGCVAIESITIAGQCETYRRKGIFCLCAYPNQLPG